MLNLKMMIKIKHTESGFTLIEVVMVIAMIGILLAIVGSQLLASLPDMRLKAAARELYSTMQRARMNAIKDNSTWGIVFDPANNLYVLCSGPGSDGSWSAYNDNPHRQIFNLASHGSGVGYGHGNITGNNSVSGKPFSQIGDVSYNSNVVTFSSKGLGGAGYVYLDNKNHSTSYAVGSLSSGVIKVLMWQGAKWR